MKLWSEHLYNYHNELRSHAIEPVNDLGELVVPGTLEKKPRAKILYLRKSKDILIATVLALTNAGFPVEVCQKIDSEAGRDYLKIIKTCLDYVEAY